MRKHILVPEYSMYVYFDGAHYTKQLVFRTE